MYKTAVYTLVSGVIHYTSKTANIKKAGFGHTAAVCLVHKLPTRPT